MVDSPNLVVDEPTKVTYVENLPNGFALAGTAAKFQQSSLYSEIVRRYTFYVS
jgi:hypothetical protein